MVRESSVNLTVIFDPALGVETRNEEVQKLLEKMDGREGIKAVDRACNPDPPGGFLTGTLVAEIERVAIRNWMRFLADELLEKTPTLKIETNGAQLEVKANTPENWMAAAQAAAALTGEEPKSETSSYQTEVKRYVRNGQFSPVGRTILDVQRSQLGLSSEEANNIENTILEPYQQHQDNLQIYRETLAAAIENNYPLSPEIRSELNGLQAALRLEDDEVATIEREFISQIAVKTEAYRDQLEQYEQRFSKAVQVKYPFSQAQRDQAKRFQQSLGLEDEDVAPIEARIIQAKEQEIQRNKQAAQQKELNLDRYEDEFLRFVRADWPLNQYALGWLECTQKFLKLTESEVNAIEQKIKDQELGTIRSDRGVDYSELRGFLATSQWQEADAETRNVMLRAVGRDASLLDQAAPLSMEEIERFPCTDLQTIDQLWSKHSQGKFGLSIQRQIYANVNCSEAAFVATVGWGDKTGWLGANLTSKPYGGLTFALEAPEGHLPTSRWACVATDNDHYVGEQPLEALFTRLEACHLPGKLDPSRQFDPSGQLPSTIILPADPADEPDDLNSERDVNYAHLQGLLKQRIWRAADQETLAVMLKAAGRERQGWLDQNAIANFPQLDLDTINKLWVKYSQGHFGFSVQQKIYAGLNARRAIDFGYRVGWILSGIKLLGFKFYHQLTFTPTAPVGHLPAYWFWRLNLPTALLLGGGPGRGGSYFDFGMLPALMSKFDEPDINSEQ
ncbi:MAG: hypothetical protein F6K19_04290 [Cyanothece sp. SIO1E1]|nr:hypothetical protein [Cyanothece sp. SIO1E1]